MGEFQGFPGEPQPSTDLQDRPLSSLVEGYLRYYASGKGHTARAKRLDIKHFMSFLASYRGYSKPEKLRVKDWDFSSVQRFIDDSLSKGEAPATVNRRLATIKHMGRTLADKVAGFVNPAREVKSTRIQVGVPQALDPVEIEAIRQKALERKNSKPSFIRLRNEVLFEFLLDTGIRAEEVRTVKRSQLDDKLEWLQSIRTKGRRFRNVYITSSVRAKLMDYLEARDRELKRFFPKISRTVDGSLPVFISTYGAQASKPESFLMGAKSVWRAIRELSSETHLHPHLLRHSYALDLLENSNDIRLVSQALGHSDVKITMRYTERRDAEVARALEKARKSKR